MDNHDNYKEGVFRGLEPHTCDFCQEIVIDRRRCDNDGVYNPGFEFGLDKVYEAVSNGCPLFRYALRLISVESTWRPWDTPVPFLRITPIIWDPHRAELEFVWEDAGDDWPYTRSMFAASSATTCLSSLLG
jgi:hypothetical protein